MPLNAASMLSANGPQMPNGVSVDPSGSMGMTGLGSALDQQSQDEFAKRRKMLSLSEGNAAMYGAADMLLGKPA
jgi:hypothetical protein